MVATGVIPGADAGGVIPKNELQSDPMPKTAKAKINVFRGDCAETKSSCTAKPLLVGLVKSWRDVESERKSGVKKRELEVKCQGRSRGSCTDIIGRVGKDSVGKKNEERDWRTKSKGLESRV